MKVNKFPVLNDCVYVFALCVEIIVFTLFLVRFTSEGTTYPTSQPAASDNSMHC